MTGKKYVGRELGELYSEQPVSIFEKGIYKVFEGIGGFLDRLLGTYPKETHGVEGSYADWDKIEVGGIDFTTYVPLLKRALKGEGVRIVPHSTVISEILNHGGKAGEIQFGAAIVPETGETRILIPEKLPERGIGRILYNVGRKVLGYDFERAVRDYGIAHEVYASQIGEETPEKHLDVERSALEGLRYLSKYGSDPEIRRRAERAYYAGLIVDYIGSKFGDELSKSIKKIYKPVKEIGSLIGSFFDRDQYKIKGVYA
jgi:hypothetical protein